MNIGIIGAGNIGGTLGHHLARAGLSVRFGVRNPEQSGVVSGSGISIGYPREAVGFAEVVIFAGPFGAWPDFARDHADALAGKVVLDASNPYPDRDGDIAKDVIASGEGSGAFVARLLPGSDVAKAFNTIYWIDLCDQAGREGERLAMPIAGASHAAEIASELARAIGFDPVVVGGIDRSADLDTSSPIYAKSFSAAQVRAALHLPTHREESQP